jgi:mannose-6-phosphate isomerase-like protein (cupin superfamily)
MKRPIDQLGKEQFMSDTVSPSTGRFDVAEIAAALPATATTLLVDTYLTNREAASARVFRVYRGTPPHYHAQCDEYLYVLSGRGTFWMKDASTKAEFGPGQLLFFERGTVHALPEILAEPLVFLSIDTPRRDPTDIIFVDPNDGTPATFMARNAAAPKVESVTDRG